MVKIKRLQVKRTSKKLDFIKKNVKKICPQPQGTYTKLKLSNTKVTKETVVHFGKANLGLLHAPLVRQADGKLRNVGRLLPPVETTRTKSSFFLHRSISTEKKK